MRNLIELIFNVCGLAHTKTLKSKKPSGLEVTHLNEL